MILLVSMTEAKRHLRIDTDDGDADLLLKIAGASAAVMNYLKTQGYIDSSGEVPTDSAGDPVGVPFEVKAATLLMLGFLDRNRDTNIDDAFERGYLPAPVTALLFPLRDPALQ